jgi:hypothetical protein
VAAASAWGFDPFAPPAAGAAHAASAAPAGWGGDPFGAAPAGHAGAALAPHASTSAAFDFLSGPSPAHADAAPALWTTPQAQPPPQQQQQQPPQQQQQQQQQQEVGALTDALGAWGGLVASGDPFASFGAAHAASHPQPPASSASTRSWEASRAASPASDVFSSAAPGLLGPRTPSPAQSPGTPPSYFASAAPQQHAAPPPSPAAAAAAGAVRELPTVRARSPALRARLCALRPFLRAPRAC